jgi:hypothetical protein
MTKNFICAVLIVVVLFGCSNNAAKTINNDPQQKIAMSSTVLKIIPTDPLYVPGKTQMDSAKSLLAKLYKKNKISVITTDTIEFVDPGSNFDSVSCNLCGRNIEIEDWQNAMDKADEHQFSDLTIITSCCHRKTSLNDLTYHSPAGFSKFIITIQDAQTEIGDKDLIQLQEAMGTAVRIIWAHY